MELSSEELEVLRAWPEFQTRLEQHRVAKAEEKVRKDREYTLRVQRLWPLCIAGSYCQHHTEEEGFKVWCSMCGVIFYPKNEQERGRLWNILRRPHWYHENGGNPARQDGNWLDWPDKNPFDLRAEMPPSA